MNSSNNASQNRDFSHFSQSNRRSQQYVDQSQSSIQTSMASAHAGTEYAADFPPLQGAGAKQKKKPVQNITGPAARFAEKSLRSAPLVDEREADQMLENIDRQWYTRTGKDTSSVTSLLKGCFSQSRNPFGLVIYFVEKCKDFHVAKTTTLAYHIVKEFDSWCKSRHFLSQELERLLSPDLRLHALNMCTRYHTTMFSFIVRSFSLRHPGNDYLLPEVKKYLTKKKYKEVSM